MSALSAGVNLASLLDWIPQLVLPSWLCAAILRHPGPCVGRKGLRSWERSSVPKSSSASESHRPAGSWCRSSEPSRAAPTARMSPAATRGRQQSPAAWLTFRVCVAASTSPALHTPWAFPPLLPLRPPPQEPSSSCPFSEASVTAGDANPAPGAPRARHRSQLLPLLSSPCSQPIWPESPPSPRSQPAPGQPRGCHRDCALPRAAGTLGESHTDSLSRRERGESARWQDGPDTCPAASGATTPFLHLLGADVSSQHG